MLSERSDRSGRRRRRFFLRPGAVAGVAVAVAACVLAGGALASPAVVLAEGIGLAISGNPPGSLYPGMAPAPIDLAFSNRNDDVVALSGLTVGIQSVSAPNATPALPCTPNDFAVTQFGATLPLAIPPGSSSLRSLGFASSSWPTVQMADAAGNQNGCIGAVVTLSYNGSGRDGPANATAPLTPPNNVGKGLSLRIAPSSQGVAIGGTAKFTFTVTNGLGVRLTGVTVSDSRVSACKRSLGVMPAGVSRKYTCSRAHVRSGFLNAATVIGKPPSGPRVSATAHARIVLTAPLTPPRLSHLTIAITPQSQLLTMVVVSREAQSSSRVAVDYPSAHFRIKVTNAGTDSLHAVTVADKLAADCGRRLGTLAPGHSRSYRCVAVLVSKGFTNLAVVTARDSKGARVTARSHARVKVRVRTTVNGKTTVGGGASAGSKGKGKSSLTATLTIPDLFFATGESTLLRGSARVLAAVVKALNAHYPSGQITVTGYTDSVGAAAYNLVLSKERATTVAGWLEQHGIHASRIRIAWKGEADPVASNATPQGRAKNRRVTITIRTGHS